MKFFIDENLPPNLAEGLNLLEHPNNEEVEVLSIQKEFGKGTRDEDWIPLVGQQQGIVITQDFNLQRTQQQYELLRKHKVSVFYLRPPGKIPYKYWQMVEKIVLHWEEIKTKSRSTKHPFAYRITPKKIELL
jgi:PIN like domain